MHWLGASPTCEARLYPSFAVLARLLPHNCQLHVEFIGPQLETPTPPPIILTSTHGRKVQMQFHIGMYERLAALNGPLAAPSPDLVFAPNAGLAEYASWGATIKMLLAQRECCWVFSSYAAIEVDAASALLWEKHKLPKTKVRTELNPKIMTLTEALMIAGGALVGVPWVSNALLTFVGEEEEQADFNRDVVEFAICGWTAMEYGSLLGWKAALHRDCRADLVDEIPSLPIIAVGADDSQPLPAFLAHWLDAAKHPACRTPIVALVADGVGSTARLRRPAEDVLKPTRAAPNGGLPTDLVRAAIAAGRLSSCDGFVAVKEDEDALVEAVKYCSLPSCVLLDFTCGGAAIARLEKSRFSARASERATLTWVAAAQARRRTLPQRAAVGLRRAHCRWMRRRRPCLRRQTPSGAAGRIR